MDFEFQLQRQSDHGNDDDGHQSESGQSDPGAGLRAGSRGSRRTVVRQRDQGHLGPSKLKRLLRAEKFHCHHDCREFR